MASNDPGPVMAAIPFEHRMLMAQQVVKVMTELRVLEGVLVAGEPTLLIMTAYDRLLSMQHELDDVAITIGRYGNG